MTFELRSVVMLVRPVPPLPTGSVPLTPMSVKEALPSNAVETDVEVRSTFKVLPVAKAVALVAVVAFPERAPAKVVAVTVPVDGFAVMLVVPNAWP